MPIPDFQTLLRPVLECAAESDSDVHIGEAIKWLGGNFDLSEEELNERTPSGAKRFYGRVHWAQKYLTSAGLLKATRRAHFQITEQGKSAVKMRQTPSTLPTETI
ncbi:MAG: winged helix-turn-helix domain-containing protein [Rhodospirillales bacterium]